MKLHISLSEGTPIYRQIVNQVKYLVASERLQPTDEMPAIRTLASDLLVNPNTVARAYRELEALGLLESRQGAGTRVAANGSPLARKEKLRILIERTDALLAEAHQLGFEAEEVVSLVKKRNTAMRKDNQKENDK